MTSMPQMVALYNGMGGGAAGAIAAVELFGNKAQGATQLVVTLLGRADRRRVAVRLADRLGQARRRHQEAVAGAGASRPSTAWSLLATLAVGGYHRLRGARRVPIRCLPCRS